MFYDRVLYQKIINLKSLKPNPKVNLLFSKLVKFSANNNAKISLNNKQIEKIRKICNLAEIELEIDFANRIIFKNAKIEDFLYYKNCLKQTILEFKNLKLFNNNIKNICFVGGGPFPLTAILLAKIFKIKVLVLEREKKYFEISSLLIKKLKLQNKIKIINEDGLNFKNYKDFDATIIAALVENKNKTKEEIINNISKNNKITLARFAENNKILLYENLDLNKIKNLKLKNTPYNDIINSFIIIKE